MIADTTFLSDLIREVRGEVRGPARQFFAANRNESIRLSMISAGEIAVLFPTNAAAWAWLARWRVLPLHPGIVDCAADVDRELIRSGERLGENDNWIAGFSRYYRQPVVSRDEAFDRVPGLRRVTY